MYKGTKIIDRNFIGVMEWFQRLFDISRLVVAVTAEGLKQPFVLYLLLISIYFLPSPVSC